MLIASAECFLHLDKFNFAKLGLGLGSSQFLILPKLLKNDARFNSGQK